MTWRICIPTEAVFGSINLKTNISSQYTIYMFFIAMSKREVYLDKVMYYQNKIQLLTFLQYLVPFVLGRHLHFIVSTFSTVHNSPKSLQCPQSVHSE